MSLGGNEMNLNFQDKKDLEKYTKHLTYKIVQVIVQSRFGEKARCHPKQDRSEWFNLAIDDVKEVNLEANKAFENEIPCLNGKSANVEVSVRTVDGDRMVLEVWSISLNDNCLDQNVQVTHTVYNRMGLLLKSLISFTRITPAYRFSREQGPECFVICYRIYVGDPQVACLGEEYKDIRIGEVRTPIGTLVLKVLYRTKLTITPHKIKKVGSLMMVNSDHFIPEVMTNFEKNVAPNGCLPNLEKMKHKSVNKINNSSFSSSGTVYNEVMDQSNESVDKDELFLKNKKIGAFASLTNGRFPDKIDSELNYIPDAPFSSLLCMNLKNSSENEISNDFVNNKDLINNSNERLKNKPSNCDINVNSSEETLQIKNFKNGLVSNYDHQINEDDDFVHVELKTPFAGHHIKNELADFFHDCRAAPSLQSFKEDQPTLEEQFNQLNDQFAEFELDLEEYDKFVTSLCTEEGID